ncbi:hypothetical protein [Lacipirellula parvula]|nr:hypothetical protein [Lacipirellula parvula]
MPEGSTTHDEKTMTTNATFPIELDSRVIECLTEPERTMLQEAHGICCDLRTSDRHSADRLREISAACHQYGLTKMGAVIATLAEHTNR